MRALLTLVIRWVSRNLASLVVIISLLVVADFFQEEVKELIAVTSALPRLIAGKGNLNQQVSLMRQEALDRMSKFEKASEDSLERELLNIENEISIKTSKQRTPMDRTLSLLSGEGVVDDFKADIAIKVLENERDFLKKLQALALATKQLQSGRDELERLRKIHVLVNNQLAENVREQVNSKADSPYLVRIPYTYEYTHLKDLETSHEEILRRNQFAHEKYKQQKNILDSIENLKQLPKFDIPKNQIDSILQPLTDHISELNNSYHSNFLAKLSQPVIHVIPTALGILFSIIFVPIAIKAVFYFLIAPLASRRPAINLSPEVSGSIDGEFANTAKAAGGVKISAVTISVEVDRTHELLVHPEYLQSSSHQGTKDTKWLLNYAYPLSSIVSGMFALTRIRANSPESFVLSDTKDPFSEIGLISIPEGSAIVLQPHSLIGIIQSTDRPVLISRHWRLGSLNAWLTLQLRFLVFHGPASLIVKGCRGIRAEIAGAGRSINQAATIGFSANLAYSNTRCETFASYLMGKKELFNDNFSEGKGFYFYEEIPHFGKKSGITGRGLEGITDSLLKIFGI